jgi:hypothetical protein
VQQQQCELLLQLLPPRADNHQPLAANQDLPNLVKAATAALVQQQVAKLQQVLVQAVQHVLQLVALQLQLQRKCWAVRS